MEMVCLVDNALICAGLRLIGFIIPWIILVCGFYLGLYTQKEFDGSPIKLIKYLKKFLRKEL
jgi:hypothetical protein